MSIDKHTGLPLLLGYTELEEHYGWKQRTLQDWVRKGKLVRPGIYPGGRAAWHLEDILRLVDSLRPRLVGASVTDPAQLQPEQLEDQARDLSAQALSKRTGMPVDPANLSLQLTNFTRWKSKSINFGSPFFGICLPTTQQSLSRS